MSGRASDLRRALLRAGGIFALGAAGGRGAHGATWTPGRPIEQLVSYSAGGGADALARYLNGLIATRNRWTIVTLNRPGGGGHVMLQSLQQAAPDGHTTGLCLSLQLGQPATPGGPLPSLDDFTWIAGVALAPMALVTRSEQRFSDVASLRAFALAEKRAITLGTTPSLEWVGDRLASALGIAVTSVPFKGGAEMMQSTLGGHVDLYVSGGSHIPLEKAGRLRTVAALTRNRLPTSPDAASLTELGIRAAIDSRFVVLAPKGLPADTAAALTAAYADAMADEGVRRHLENTLNLIGAWLPPAELRRTLALEVAAAKE